MQVRNSKWLPGVAGQVFVNIRDIVRNAVTCDSTIGCSKRQNWSPSRLGWVSLHYDLSQVSSLPTVSLTFSSCLCTRPYFEVRMSVIANQPKKARPIRSKYMETRHVLVSSRQLDSDIVLGLSAAPPCWWGKWFSPFVAWCTPWFEDMNTATPTR